MASFRRPLKAKNALVAVREDQELSAAASPVKKKTPSKAAALSPSKPTAADLADADAALARMEAALAAKAPPPPPPLSDSDSDSSGEDEAGAAAATRKSTSWRKSCGRRGSSSRRESLEHVKTHAERCALRRLSRILRDGGAARRAREASESEKIVAAADAREARRKRLSLRRKRLKSIAKIMDLAAVWQWLEAEGDGGDDGASDDDADDADLAADDAAVAVVARLSTAVAEAQGAALRLSVGGGAEARRMGVCRAIRDLASLAPLAAAAAAYDAKRGFYALHVALPVGSSTQTVCVERSWRDLVKLRKGLALRLGAGAAATLPKLPKPRLVSVLKRSVRNAAGSNRRGDRKWQKSKLPAVDAWLAKTLAAVVAAPRRGAVRDADEYLEDFLFKFGSVVDA